MFEAQPDCEPGWHGQALSNLGVFLLRSRRDPNGAMDFFEKATNVAKGSKFGPSKELQVTLLENRGEALESMGRIDEATVLRNEAAKIRSLSPCSKT